MISIYNLFLLGASGVETNTDIIHKIEVIKHVNDGFGFGESISLFTALAACAISIASFYISYKALAVQRKHNELSVCPIPDISIADYENSLRVKIKNTGQGPMLIKEVIVSKGNQEKSSIIDWLGGVAGDRPWNHFSLCLKGKSITSGNSITLIDITKRDEDDRFEIIRDKCREKLKDLTVKVTYTNIYETESSKERGLEYFGRRL